ncbi:hypothetical protein M153_1590003390 [Pseudoloma neurophilia]|uniref:Uncharacterized protein n=1 Tax=Pseudoloma neurophilia TaxID=146866 RepID=A0A0R0M5A9_9MICR|nr:hypothetical protein M153_1590003390 [Pseudoloma neurophilia]
MMNNLQQPQEEVLNKLLDSDKLDRQNVRNSIFKTSDIIRPMTTTLTKQHMADICRD